jgi:hypothetical protein
MPLHDGRDLDPLLARIGHARFVLLGEASHGTQERERIPGPMIMYTKLYILKDRGRVRQRTGGDGRLRLAVFS